MPEQQGEELLHPVAHKHRQYEDGVFDGAGVGIEEGAVGSWVGCVDGEEGVGCTEGEKGAGDDGVTVGARVGAT